MSSPPPNIRIRSSLRSFSRAAGIAVIAVGCLALLGWALDVAVLRGVFPGLATMKANTALAFILAGLSLSLYCRMRNTPPLLSPRERGEAPPMVPPRAGGQDSLSVHGEGWGEVQIRNPKSEIKNWQRRLGQACAAAVALIGLLTLSEYLFGWDPGIDQALFMDTAAGAPYPGRMSPMTALSFFLIGAALLLLHARRGDLLAQALTLAIALISLLALVGYLYNVSALYAVGPYGSMALHTGLSFTILCAGALCARLDRGLVGILVSDTAAGGMARRLLPVAVGVPIGMGWLRLLGQRAGLYDTEFGLALFAILNVVLFITFILWTARSLFRMDVARQRAEEALDRSRAMFEDLYEFTPDSVVVVDREGRIVRINKQGEKSFGYSREELLGKPVEMLVPERFRDRHAGHRAGYFADPHMRPMGAGLDLHARRRDGSEFPVEISLGPLETDDGVVVLSVIRDVTERKRAEEERVRLSMAVAQVAESIVITDLDGTILYVNPAFERITGYSREEVIGQNPRILKSSRHDAAFYQRMWDTITQGKSWTGHFIDRRKDGTLFEEEAVISPVLDPAGKIVNYIAVIRDVTERRRADEALAQKAEELARSNAELEQFAYVASHDLQEPLRAVAGCAQILQRRYKGQLDARADELIAHTVEGVTRMQTLVNDLLAFSRVGTRGRPFEPTDCSAVVKQVLASLEVAIKESEAVVTHDTLPVVMADPMQLTQVFQNLIGNAIKFRGERPPEVRLGAERKEGEWLFSVCDNGVGIDPQYSERIFVIFQRLHTRTEYPGTGIGLAICKKIVERHGGRIWVESEPGKGTTFYFTIPAREG